MWDRTQCLRTYAIRKMNFLLNTLQSYELFAQKITGYLYYSCFMSIPLKKGKLEIWSMYEAKKKELGSISDFFLLFILYCMKISQRREG